jgi:hypothetical protein
MWFVMKCLSLFRYTSQNIHKSQMKYFWSLMMMSTLCLSKVSVINVIIVNENKPIAHRLFAYNKKHKNIILRVWRI